MYLHIGNDVVLSRKSIIGIFDMDIGTDLHAAEVFLNAAQKENRIRTVSDDIPKSYIVCQKNGETLVYLSPLATATLKKRWTDNVL